ncbi:MAG TPA: hypothetical protein VIK48_05025, partial [Candidatus Manganitrophaceae bacterium]
MKKVLAGWIFDVYPIQGGMRLWIIDPQGNKHPLIDPFTPSFYIDGPSSILRSLFSFLSGLNLPLKIKPAEGIEFYSGRPIPVFEVRVLNPLHFSKITRWMTAFQNKLDGAEISLYNFDISLPQLYFFEKGSFPLAFSEIEVDAEGRVLALAPRDSIWSVDYTIPPLSIMTLRMEGEAIRPDQTGPRRLEIGVDGKSRCLEGDDEAALIEQFNRLLLRHDPDLILSEWGDPCILPRLIQS